MTHTHGHIDYLEFTSSDREELARKKQFFSQAFGWQWKDWGDAYADTHDSGTTSGIAIADESGAPQCLVVMYSDSLEATKEQVCAAGGRITREIFAFPGGRRFHFTDPTGTEMAVWSSS